VKEKVNYIDTGKGDDLTLNLAVNEFDPSMTAHINFRNALSFQVLITNLGVEELRAAVHYQLMQYQLLSMSVHLNQTLIEGNMKGLYELEYLTEKDGLAFCLPDPNIKLSSVLSK
jgi:hypothetical protein